MIDIAAAKAKAPSLLTLAEATTTLRKSSATNGGEWSGPCPFCGGRDRFSVQPYHVPEARWLCRHCTDGKWKDVIHFVERRDNTNFMDACRALFGPGVQISPEESARLLAERTARQEEERRLEAAKQQERRAQLDASGAALEYWRNLEEYPEARTMWEKRGLSRIWQDYFQVGYSPSRQYKQGDEFFTSASLTIPTWKPYPIQTKPEGEDLGSYSIAWKCIGLAHRLLTPLEPSDKYRPHLSGTGKPLFNCDIYTPELLGDVLLVEGEIKAAVTWAYIQDTHPAPSYLLRLTVVGIAGKSFKLESVPEFNNAGTIWVCLDPDASAKEANSIAVALGADRCRIIDLPGKIDDLLVDGTLQIEHLQRLMNTARAVLP